MEELISICIPTYHRLPLLKEAIASCLAQNYRPLELVIGDNSTDDVTEDFIKKLVPPKGVTLRYIHHRPSCGQATNVNRLFDSAEGSRLLLLHDDDLLCENGLDILAKTWDRFPGARCVYGNQYLINAAGEILPAASEELNTFYSRVPQMEGRQASCLEAAFKQQIPNNSFLIETALAQKIRYRTETEVGHSIDTDFGIRLGAAVESGAFVYVNKYTAKNRESDTSILRSKKINHGQHLFYSQVEKFPVRSPAEQAAEEALLSRIAALASLDAAMAGDRRLALKIIFSKHYGRPLFSHWTLFRLFFIISPRLGEMSGHLFRR